MGWCLLSALLFGATTPAAKPLVDDMGPVLLSGVLYWGAAIGVAPWALREWNRQRGRRTASVRARRHLLGAAFFGGVVGPVLLLWGLSLAPAGSVSLWLVLETVATAVLARLFFREHLGAYGWFATALVVLASALLTEPGPAGIQAVTLVALACVAWGLDNNFTALIDNYSTTEITAFKGVTAGLVNVPVGLWLGGIVEAGSLLTGLAIGALGYGASLVLYTAGAQQLGATRSQLCFSTSPLFGLATAALLLGESLGAAHAISIGLMALAVGLLQRETHEHAHRHHAIEHTHWHRHDDGHHDHAPEDADAVTLWHQHRHRHEAQTHRHPHRPDLHHRHSHADSESQT